MQRLLALLACVSLTYAQDEYLNHYYEVPPDLLNGNDAFTMANAYGGYLVSLRSKEEESYVWAKLARYGTTIQRAWIGAADRIREAHIMWESEPQFDIYGKANPYYREFFYDSKTLCGWQNVNRNHNGVVRSTTTNATEPCDCAALCDLDSGCLFWSHWASTKTCQLKNTGSFTSCSSNCPTSGQKGELGCSCAGKGRGGVAIAGKFENFAPNEPNDYRVQNVLGEDCNVVGWGGQQWNDLPCDGRGYGAIQLIVEYDYVKDFDQLSFTAQAFTLTYLGFQTAVKHRFRFVVPGDLGGFHVKLSLSFKRDDGNTADPVSSLRVICRKNYLLATGVRAGEHIKNETVPRGSLVFEIKEIYPGTYWCEMDVNKTQTASKINFEATMRMDVDEFAFPGDELTVNIPPRRLSPYQFKLANTAGQKDVVWLRIATADGSNKAIDMYMRTRQAFISFADATNAPYASNIANAKYNSVSMRNPAPEMLYVMVVDTKDALVLYAKKEDSAQLSWVKPTVTMPYTFTIGPHAPRWLHFRMWDQQAAGYQVTMDVNKGGSTTNLQGSIRMSETAFPDSTTAFAKPLAPFTSNFSLTTTKGGSTPTDIYYMFQTGDLTASQQYTVNISFSKPIITGFTTSAVYNAPTGGNVPVTINGKYFPDINTPTVKIGNSVCTGVIVGSAGESLSCLLPAGEGRNLTVELSNVLSTVYPSSTRAGFDYDPPEVLQAQFTSPSTRGDSTPLLALIGKNFGSTGKASVTVGARVFALAASSSHIQLNVIVPEGQGFQLPIAVVVAGQSQVSPMLYFSYAGPRLLRVEVEEGSTEGGNDVTLHGENFGTVPSWLKVTIGGVSCGNVRIVTRHSQINCTVPASSLPGPYPVKVTMTDATTGVFKMTQELVSYTYRFGSFENYTAPSMPTKGQVLVTVNANSDAAFGTVAQPLKLSIPGVVLAQDITVQSWSQKKITFFSPAGQGSSTLYLANNPTSRITLRYDSPTFIRPASQPDAFTTTGGLLTIIGTNFGLAISQVVLKVNDTQVAVQQLADHESVVATMPAGVGVVSMSITVSGATSDPFTVSYPSPSITGPLTGNFYTNGNGASLTIAGKNFGQYVPGDSTVEVTVSGQVLSCPISSPSNWNHATIICNLPAGQGTGAVVVTAGQKSSNNQTFQYLPPTLTKITYIATGTGAVTSREGVITLVGANFGTALNLISISFTKATKTAIPCVPTNVNTLQTQIICELGPGVGTGWSVLLTIASQAATNTPNFDYPAPKLVSYDPPGTRTLPIVPIRLTGTNFGASAAEVSVTIGAQPCVLTAGTPPEHETISCFPPPLYGVDLPIIVNVGNQSVSKSMFTYAKVTVSKVECGGGTNSAVDVVVEGSPVTIGTAIDCPTDSNTLTFTGINFGPSCTSGNCGADRQVFIETVNGRNGQECTGVAITNHTSLTCTYPQSAKGGFEYEVVVSIAGVTTVIPKGLSYAGPAFKNPAITGALASSAAGRVITLAGKEFGSVGWIVKYGVSGKGFPYDCTVTGNSTSVQCLTTERAGGRNIVFQITTASNLTSLPTIDTVNFPEHQAIAFAGGGRVFTATQSSGANVVIKAKHVGLKAAGIEVTYGLYKCPVLKVEADADSQTSLITCEAPPGVGQNLSVSLLLWGAAQSSPTGLIFNYPPEPVITKVSGCTEDPSNAAVTMGCPTNGVDGAGQPIILSISMKSGSFIPSNLTNLNDIQVFVGIDECLGLTLTGTSSTNYGLTCRLPQGKGSDLSVLVRNGEKQSVKLPFVSYAKPTITAVSFNGADATKMLRTGGQQITIVGNNFGASGAVVLAGGSVCGNLTHGTAGTNLHSQVTCDLPAGEGTNKQIFLIVGGVLSDVNFFSYEQCRAGTYILFPGSTTCKNCSAGSISAVEGQVACTTCIDGQYSGSEGRSVCEPCPAGTQAKASVVGRGNDMCEPCAKGYYSSQPGAAVCSACEAGDYTDVVNSTACLQCEKGKISGNRAEICTNCIAGYYAPSKGLSQCESCPTGTASNLTGQSRCPFCTPGRFASSTGYTVCQDCPKGRATASQGQVQCTGCATGTKGNRTQLSECFACEAGRFQDESEGEDCKECIEGSFQASDGQKSCVQCAAGTACPGKSTIIPLICPPGTESGGGAIACNNCSAGYMSVDAVTGCQQCAPGRANEIEGQRECKLCQPGFFQDEQGKNECKACPAGRSASGMGQKSCTECDAGRSSPGGLPACAVCLKGESTKGLTEQSTCAGCEPGYFAAYGGMVDCLQCDPGFYASEPNSTQCLACDAGSHTDTVASVTCTNCTKGHFASVSGSKLCEKCEVGRYAYDNGAKTCMACEVGRAGVGVGAVNCDDCLPGYFGDREANGRCQPCPGGEYSNTTRASECIKCSPGYVQLAPGMDGCDECAFGQFQPAPGQQTCEWCLPGRYQPERAQVKCLDCEFGTYSRDGRGSVCDACEAGKFIDVKSQVFCKPCNTGYYQNATGQSNCSPCKVGRFSQSNEFGTVECSACQPGKFAGSERSGQCYDCDFGTFANTTEMGQCHSAQQGYHVPRRQSQEQTPCGTGYFNSAIGQSVCEICVVGTYQDMLAQNSCKDAEKGYYVAISAASNQLPCKEGNFNGATGQSTCKQCQEGHYQNQTAQIACLDADKGYFVAQKEAVEQMPCTGGSYNPASAQSACSLCEIGRFTDMEASTACTACYAGSVQANQGQTNCTKCRPGSSQAAPGQADCSRCTPGFFIDEIGATNCSACPSGRAQSQAGAVSCLICTRGYFAAQGQPECTLCPVATVSLAPGTAFCSACPENADSNTERTTCMCQVGFAAKLVGGAAVVAAGGMNINCVKCPEGANCKVPGVFWDTMETLPGWWEEGKDYYRCLNDLFCPGGPNTGNNSLCAPNREGLLCQQVKSGFTQNVVGVAVPCGSKEASIVFTILLCIGVGVVVAGMFYIILRSGAELVEAAKRQDITRKENAAGYVNDHEDPFSDQMLRHEPIISIFGAPPAKPSFTFKMKILISFVQIVSSVATGLEIRWPSVLKRFLSAFNIFNLDFFEGAQVSCIVETNYFQKLWVTCTIPAVCMAMLVVLFMVPSVLSVHRAENPVAERKSVRHRFWKLTTYALYLIYPTVSSEVARLYVCKQIRGQSYLVASDFTIKCTSPEWLEAALINIPFVLLWPLGIPLFFFVLIYRYRHRLHESGTRVCFGLLFDAYERHVWWFEMVDMAHKMSLTCVIAYFDQSIQMAVGMVFAALFLITILVLQPYVRKADDRLIMLAQSELLLLFMAGYIFNQGLEIPESLETVVGLFMIGLVFLFLFYALITTYKSLRKSFNTTKLGTRFNKFVDDSYEALPWIKRERRNQKLMCERLGLTEEDMKIKTGYEFYKDLDIEYTFQRKMKEFRKRATTLESPVKLLRNPMMSNTGGIATMDATGEMMKVQANPMLMELDETGESKLTTEEQLAALEAPKPRHKKKTPSDVRDSAMDGFWKGATPRAKSSSIPEVDPDPNDADHAKPMAGPVFAEEAPTIIPKEHHHKM